ncbi:MAG: hypothetical protein DI534_08585 [Leifsonia xyli]|nr:MAG: hypothetical protein DI534_08585 [Leifsonia xyli]
MRPTDPTESRIAARSRQGGVGGGHWELLRADGLALLVRTRNVDDLTVARVDADRVFARRDELRVLYVRDHEAGQLSWWLVDRTEAVLVAARVWSAAQRTEVLANARLALAALAAPHPWGEYDPF